MQELTTYLEDYLASMFFNIIIKKKKVYIYRAFINIYLFFFFSILKQFIIFFFF